MEATRPISDAALVRRCRDGDDEAWNMLVERFSRYVYAICVQAFRLPPSDAEDAFQDVFAKVFEQLPKLRDDGSVRPWIAQLTRRTCIDRLRADRHETPIDDVEPAGVDDRVASLDEALAVRESLRHLTEACQEILDRFFARDESYRTIAEALDIPPGTIASRISRCLEKLKAAMEDVEPSHRPVDG
ncbi:MAG: RNA polymerase sigma factor [Gaiellaceae bacterium]